MTEIQNSKHTLDGRTFLITHIEYDLFDIVWDIWYLDFEIVSDFVLRISNFLPFSDKTIILRN